MISSTAKPVFDELARGIVRDEHGIERSVDSHVNSGEARYLVDLIESDPTIVRGIEIGFAFGVSALHICEALRGREGARYTILDPKQESVWDNVGRAQLERAGIDFFELMTERSEYGLVDLLRRDGEGSADFVFIDGWHSFDQVMVDAYFATRLLRTGGYVAFDDANWAAVASAIAYFETYPAFTRVTDRPLPPQSLKQRIAYVGSRYLTPAVAKWALPAALYERVYSRARFPSLVVLRKTEDDKRDFSYFQGL